MSCLCQKMAGKDVELSPTCIGNLWIFQDLAPKDIQALAQDALRKKITKGQTLFMQGNLKTWCYNTLLLDSKL